MESEALVHCYALQQKAQKSGSGTSLSGGDSDQNVRKVLARQHAKDISEYTKQIHSKDRELTEIKKKVAKVKMLESCSMCSGS